MIRIQMIRGNTRDPDRRKRHPSRASCEVAGRRYETTGPAPIYRIVTLLWLEGHGGAGFEVWDDVSPFGKPGGLALRGKVRNWARLVNGTPKFNKDAPSETEFSPHERDQIARAAGRVSDAAQIDSPPPDKARSCATRPSGGPEYPRDGEGTSTRVFTACSSEPA